MICLRQIVFSIIFVSSVISFSSNDSLFRFGFFVSPTLHLDYRYARDKEGLGPTFWNDHIPLFGLHVEKALNKNVVALKVGFEPIFSWGSYYGFSLDQSVSFKFGYEKLKMALAAGYMFRSKPSLRQHAAYFTLGPSFRFWNHFEIEPCFGLAAFNETDFEFPLSDGKFGRYFGRLNLVFVF